MVWCYRECGYSRPLDRHTPVFERSTHSGAWPVCRPLRADRTGMWVECHETEITIRSTLYRCLFCVTSGCLGQLRAGPSLTFCGIYICGVMSMGIQARVYQGFFILQFCRRGFCYMTTRPCSIQHSRRGRILVYIMNQVFWYDSKRSKKKKKKHIT